MDQFIRAISPRAEFAIVVLIAFGYFILGSVFSVFDQSIQKSISETELHGLFAHELIVIVVLAAFLKTRGWSLGKLGFRPGIKDTAIGIALAVCAYVSYSFIWILTDTIAPGMLGNADKLIMSGLNLMTVLAISVLNPVFEEVFVCGYIIAALKDARGLSFAVNISVAIRLAYHLYQGPAGIINIVSGGLIFAYWFAKTGRLWPVVSAHAFLDLASLWSYVTA